MKKKKASLLLTLVLVVLAAIFGVTNLDEVPEASLPDDSLVGTVTTPETIDQDVTDAVSNQLDPDGSYTTKEDVALYI